MEAGIQLGFPTPVFIHRSSVEAADKFFDKRAPDARRIADPDGKLFAAFGLGRGSLWRLMGPRVLWRGLSATLKGHFAGWPKGDVAQMPGAFLVRGDEILWEHRASHSAEHPDLAAMLAASGVSGQRGQKHASRS